LTTSRKKAQQTRRKASDLSTTMDHNKPQK
jgi:rRNA maturation protein Rpf1